MELLNLKRQVKSFYFEFKFKQQIIYNYNIIKGS